jgi:hypothetical protein
MAASVVFDVRGSLRESLKRFEGAVNADIERAVPRALNRTLTTVRAASARQLAKFYPGLKRSTLKRQIKFKRATVSSQTASLTFSGKRFRLFGNFNVRRKQFRWGTGIAPSARLPGFLERGDGTPITPEDLNRVFLQRPKGGAANWWLREGKARMPISVVVVRGLSAAFVEGQVASALGPVARARFMRALEQELKFRTGG